MSFLERYYRQRDFLIFGEKYRGRFVFIFHFKKKNNLSFSLLVFPHLQKNNLLHTGHKTGFSFPERVIRVQDSTWFFLFQSTDMIAVAELIQLSIRLRKVEHCYNVVP